MPALNKRWQPEHLYCAAPAGTAAMALTTNVQRYITDSGYL